MQKEANLVELEKCCQTHIFLQIFVLIQPRTSPPKICKILLRFACRRSPVPFASGATADFFLSFLFFRVFLRFLRDTSSSFSKKLKKLMHQVAADRLIANAEDKRLFDAKFGLPPSCNGSFVCITLSKTFLG